MKLRPTSSGKDVRLKSTQPAVSNQITPDVPIELDTFNGKFHVEWDPNANVTPLGQLPFFIQFLKILPH